MYAEDVEYLLSNYGDKRGHDALLVLREVDGNEGPVLKSFATIMPPTSTDCFGRTSPIPLYRPDSDWRRQTDLVRTTFRRDLDHLHLFADSGALDRVQAAGFDGIAIYDSFLRPARAGHRSRAPAVTSRSSLVQHQLRLRQHLPARGAAELSVTARPASSRPRRSTGPASLDRERARLLAEAHRRHRARMTLTLQTDATLTDNGAGFFMVYINSFNEWHEGTSFEPMRNSRDLLPDEIPLQVPATQVTAHTGWTTSRDCSEPITAYGPSLRKLRGRATRSVRASARAEDRAYVHGPTPVPA